MGLHTIYSTPSTSKLPLIMSKERSQGWEESPADSAKSFVKLPEVLLTLAFSAVSAGSSRMI